MTEVCQVESSERSLDSNFSAASSFLNVVDMISGEGKGRLLAFEVIEEDLELEVLEEADEEVLDCAAATAARVAMVKTHFILLIMRWEMDVLVGG